MVTLRAKAWWGLVCLFLGSACAGGGAPGAVAPAGAPTTGLPEIPAADGALAISITYPPENAVIAVSDSNFIFGSVGSGLASLRIDGAPVDVAPNGAFLAFVPVPEDGVYDLVATKDGQSVSRAHAIRLPAAPTLPADGPGIIAPSVYPSGPMALPPGETVEVGFRGTAGGRAHLVLPDGRRVWLEETPVLSGPTADAQNFRTDAAGARMRTDVSWYRGRFAVTPLRAQGAVVAQPALATIDSVATSAPDTLLTLPRTWAMLELVQGSDTARTALPLNLARLDPAGRVAIARAPEGAPHDWTARGRPSTAGPFHWFFPPGTRLLLDGERGGFVRARLAPDHSAWLARADLLLLPEGAPAPAADIGGVRFIAARDWIDLRIPVGTRLPYSVDGDGASLTLDLYGATSETNFFQYGSLDPLIERAMWSQPQDGIYRVRVDLTQPVWGYHVFYDANDALVLRIRRPPVIDPARPLAGLLIGVDPGHPPTGSTGPTGLTEAEANLAIALKLRPLLEAAGARVMMTRTDAGPVDLGLRPRMAADSNVHVLLSVHNNAFPDGVNPWENAGTSVYFYQPHSLDLARHVQRELLAALDTRDIGVGRADLALARPTWMPSMLSETLYMMLPQHEAALRDPATQERIAAAHVRALEAFLRDRAEAQTR